MKTLFALALMISATAHAGETRIVGAAAEELYASLNLPEVAVHDEHGGADYATAKYGKNLGCVKQLQGSTECWILN